MCEHVCDERVTKVLKVDRSCLWKKTVILWCMLIIDCMAVNSFIYLFLTETLFLEI